MKNFILILLLVLPFSLRAQQMNEHTVASGETFQSIANKYSITISELKKANPGLDDYLIVGMVLKIPSGATEQKKEKTIIDLEDDLKDVIFLKDGSELVAKISTIDTDSVKFEQYDTDELFSIPIQRILSITFEDGSIRSFPEPKPINVKKTKTVKRRK